MELVPLILVAPLLLAMAYGDLRYMRISNRLVLAMLALFIVTAPMLGSDAVLERMIAASAVFAIGFLAFSFGVLGGGDVKALSALMLFVPSTHVVLFFELFSLFLFLAIVGMTSVRAVPASRRSGWVSLRAKGMLPMGVSIAAAGLALPILTF